MIWYLLYPLRGTTLPPRLSQDHFVRKAFYRHGILVAHHWLLTMLIAVAIGVGLSYPTVFLSENPTAGFTNLPSPLWTTAKHVDIAEGRTADVEMRQIWVHGSYMRALEKDVLKSALTIQQNLVGSEKLTTTFPELGENLGSSELSWGYHSPLMYWNSSAAAIDADTDLVQTINEQSRSSSSLNVALRPASVFAGKTFHHRKLVAADALVLTFLNKIEDGVGGKWQGKMQSLEGNACENCTLYPPHGEINRSRVYDFSFTPLSFRENAALALAYGCMALYVLMSLRRLKAFHSRFGLVVTAVTQVTTSIVVSFTICGVLRINLATIPQNAYPFIVLIIGIENMFRLINAVLEYPATMATDLRIANALGDVGPLSVATAAQNLIILWLLSTIVSPGVKAFCAYAIIATLFDSFFLLTFFVAVLNVDIRRLELQDSISRSNQATQNRRPQPAQRTWFDALMHGRVPFSTRMAGSAVTTTFILSLNYHFFERKETVLKLRHLLGFVVGHSTDDLSEYETFASPPMNATLTPGEWIRMQDFDTAREVMRLVKPGSHNLVIRIFSPLIVVLSGADRTGVPQGMDAVASALRGFALHHFYPFAVVVVFVVAFVAVLMNFLLWNEALEISVEAAERAEDGLSVQHIDLPHRLDIVKIASSSRGHVMTIALDRTIIVSIYDHTQAIYLVDDLSPELNARLTWPIRNIAVDEAGELVAFLCATDEVVIFTRASRSTLGHSFRAPDDHPPIVFGFEYLSSARGLQPHFLMLSSGGRSVSLCIGDEIEGPVTTSISQTPLLGASVINMASQEKRLFTISETGRIDRHCFENGRWIQPAQTNSSLSAHLESVSGAVSIKPLTDGEDDMLVINCAATWYLFDALTMTVALSSPSTEKGQSSTLVLGQRTTCDACGGLALLGLATACQSPKTQELTIELRGRETTSETDIYGFCVRRERQICSTMDDTFRTTHSLSNPGTWRALPSHALLGIRKRPVSTPEPSTSHSHLRHRRSARSQHRLTASHDHEEWEAYSLAISGELKTISLSPPATSSSDIDESLYVTKPGPTAALDSDAIAVAFGNNVKLLRASTLTSPTRLARPGPPSRVSNTVTSRRRGTGSGRKTL